MRTSRALLMGLVVGGWVSAAHAGWVIEQNGVAAKLKGETSPAEPSTMRISQGRIRVMQPSTTMVKDCVKERLMIFVPDRNVYWAGTFAEYASELDTEQIKAAYGGNLPEGLARPTPQPTAKEGDVKLPAIVVKKTEEHATLGGYDTVKYTVESNGTLFQELWVTTAFTLNDDLEPKKYLACEAKTAGAMRGASADALKALYRSPDYLNLASSGVAMKTVVYHTAGTYTREVRSISRTDVPDSDFATPEAAQKVGLGELFAAPGH